MKKIKIWKRKYSRHQKSARPENMCQYFHESLLLLDGWQLIGVHPSKSALIRLKPTLH